MTTGKMAEPESSSKRAAMVIMAACLALGCREASVASEPEPLPEPAPAVFCDHCYADLTKLETVLGSQVTRLRGLRRVRDRQERYRATVKTFGDFQSELQKWSASVRCERVAPPEVAALFRSYRHATLRQNRAGMESFQARLEGRPTHATLELEAADRRESASRVALGAALARHCPAWRPPERTLAVVGPPLASDLAVANARLVLRQARPTGEESP